MAKYKAKLNSKEKVASTKRRKVKETKYKSETEEEIIRFLIILGVVIVFVIGVYFVSRLIVNNRNKPAEDASTPGEIDYSTISVGTIFNRPYTEYYVMVYDKDDTNAAYYSALITQYQKNQDATKMYFCDLSNSLNSSYIADEGKSNPLAKTIDELAFGDITLLKIKNGKITKYIETVKEIETVLQ